MNMYRSEIELLIPASDQAEADAAAEAVAKFAEDKGINASVEVVLPAVGSRVGERA